MKLKINFYFKKIVDINKFFDMKKFLIPKAPQSWIRVARVLVRTCVRVCICVSCLGAAPARLPSVPPQRGPQAWPPAWPPSVAPQRGPQRGPQDILLSCSPCPGTPQEPTGGEATHRRRHVQASTRAGTQAGLASVRSLLALVGIQAGKLCM